MPTIPMGSQLYPGRGLDTVTGSVFGRAISFDDLQQNAGGGIEVQFTFESITSSRELTEKLSISASASFAGAWGVSAEFGLRTSKHVNSYYTYALLTCRVLNPPKTLRNPRLTPVAEKLLVESGWEKFVEAYGSEYIEGFLLGGSYYALLEVQTANETEQRKVKAKLSGYYGPFKASAKFESDMKDIAKSTTINVSVARSGGGGTVVPIELGAMIEEARNFPTVAMAQPVEIMALTAEYRKTVPLPSVLPGDHLVRLQQQQTLTDLGRAFLRLRDYKANLEFILQQPLSNFDDFRDLDDAELARQFEKFSDALKDVSVEIDRVVDQARRCTTSAADCQTYATSVQFLRLPRIQGEMMTLRQIEDKLAALGSALSASGLLGTGTATFQGSCAVKGAVTVGSGGNARLVSRHVDGKQVDSDGPGSLTLNWDNGQPVQVGGANRSDLNVYGDINAEGGDVRIGDGRSVTAAGRGHVRCDERLYLMARDGVMVSDANGGAGHLHVQGKIGVGGIHPIDGLPPEIGGGVHTWDVVAQGGVMVGPPGEVKAAMWNDGTLRAKEKKFVIDHPLNDDDYLVHGALEGPEMGVYYRGESVVTDASTVVSLPEYFESLVRLDDRSVLVTPIVESTPDSVVALAASRVTDGRFTVYSLNPRPEPQRFYWEVKGVRADVKLLDVEVRKSSGHNV